MIEMKVSFDTDRARAMEDTKVWAALALSGEQKVGVEDPREMERLAKTVEDVAHRRWLVSSDPDEHVEQIATYVEYGLRPPGLPLPRRRPGSGDRPLRGADPAAAARALRLTWPASEADAAGRAPPRARRGSDQRA